MVVQKQEDVAEVTVVDEDDAILEALIAEEQALAEAQQEVDVLPPLSSEEVEVEEIKAAVEEAQAPVQAVAAPAPQVVEEQPVTVVAPTTKRGHVKGTWTQYYGTQRFDFVDRKAYDLPIDVYNYLKSKGCLYDTLV